MYRKIVLTSQSEDSQIVIHSIFGRALAVVLYEQHNGEIVKTRLHGFRRRATFMRMLYEMMALEENSADVELPPAQPWPWPAPNPEDLNRYTWLEAQ